MATSLGGLLSKMAAIEARVRALENAAPRLHYAETCPYDGDAFAPNVVSLGAGGGMSALQNLLVPLKLTAPIEATRFTTIISTDGGGSVGYGMALYKMQPRPYNLTATWLTNQPPTFALVRSLGVFTTSTAAGTPLDWAIQLSGSVLMTPEDGWCIAVHVTDNTNGKILKPGYTLGDFGPHFGIYCRPLSTALGNFPATLGGYKTKAAPWISVRSKQGVERFANHEVD